jgi:hypothetical protein
MCYPTTVPTENNLLNYFKLNKTIFQFEDKLFDGVVANTNIDGLKNKLKPTLDKYVKTLITHNLIKFLYYNNTLNLNNDLKFCTYIDQSSITKSESESESESKSESESESESESDEQPSSDEKKKHYKKMPNLFYCLKNNESQPFDYLNKYDKYLFDQIELNLFTSMSRTFPTHFEELECKKFAIQYITNEYTIKINQISNNFNQIKSINFNETYIILFIISVIIIYSILLFFI